jgi:hypothetical protein
MPNHSFLSRPRPAIVSFPRRVIMGCLSVGCFVAAGILVHSVAWSQSSASQRATETLYQRWIPTTDDSSQDPQRLLQKLRKQKLSPTDLPSLPWASPDSLPKDGKGLPQKLPELTPSQLEQLRRIAEKYVQDGNPPLKAEDLDRLPPKLLEQLKQSPELQKIAKEIAEQAREKKAESADDTGKAQDPFAPVPPTSSSNTLQRMLEQTDAPNASSESKNSKQQPKSSRPDAQPANTLSKDASKGAEQETNERSPSSSTESSDESNGTKEQPGIGLPNAGQSPQRSADQTPSRSAAPRTPAPNNPQFRPRTAGDETNPSPRSGSSSKNPSFKSPGVSPLPEKRTQNAAPSVPVESAVEKIQRKFRELGFGKAMEQIVIEAAGLERSESTGRNSSASSKNANSNTPTNATRPSKTRSNEPPLASAPTPRKSNTSSRDSSLSNSNRAMTESRRPSPPPQVSKSTETTSPFELPKLALPKFSIGWLVALLSILVCGIALWMLSKDPVVAAKVFGIKSPTLGSANIVTKDIRTRSDVVEAFHQLVETKFRSFESWWTSRRALQQVDKNLPSLTPPMREATEIYELARYLPSDQELSDSDLQRMRQAMEKCSLTGVLQ